MKFKPGDKVVRIHNFGNLWEPNKVYTVRRYYGKDFFNTEEMKNVEGLEVWFELYKPEKTEKELLLKKINKTKEILESLENNYKELTKQPLSFKDCYFPVYKQPYNFGKYSIGNSPVDLLNFKTQNNNFIGFLSINTGYVEDKDGNQIKIESQLDDIES